MSAGSRQSAVASQVGRLLKSDTFCLLILLVAVTILALPVLTYPLGRDQGEFATLGRGILNGRIPYKELWNPKPPAVFYVYGLAMRLFGQTSEALRVIDLFIALPICLCLYWLGRHLLNRRVGLWAAVLFPVFYFTETFWTLTQNDGIALLPMTLAAAGVVKAASYPSPRSHHWLLAFCSGALCGYVVWFKYPFVVFVAAMIIGYVVRRRTRGLSLQQTDLHIALAFGAGGLIVLLGGAIYLIAIDAFDELVTSARVTSQYTLLTFNWNDFQELIGTALGYRWQHWGLLGVLAVLSVTRRQSKVVSHESRVAGESITVSGSALHTQRSTLFILFWLLAGLVIMLAQAKGYDYHWLPMLPPLVLMGATGLDRVLTRVVAIFSRSSVETRHASSLLQIIAALLLLGIMVNGIWPRAWKYLTGQENRAMYYGRFVAGAAEEFNAADSLKVANLLRERVVPGDSLYIWGFRPEVYYLSGLNPGSRFFFHFPLVAEWYPPEWRKQNVDTLWASLPPYVLVLQVDYMPWVIGREEDSNALLQEYTDLNDWLIFNYERDTQIGNFFVWRRKS